MEREFLDLLTIRNCQALKPCKAIVYYSDQVSHILCLLFLQTPLV